MPATPFVDFAALPATRALHWFAEGARLWRRAPVMLFLLAFVPLLVEGLVQLIPLVGFVLSKFVAPLMSFGLIFGLDALARGERLRVSHLFMPFRDGHFSGAARLVLWTMLVPALQVTVATIVYGPAALDAIVLGHILQHPELMTTRAFSWWLILPGIPLAVLLMTLPPPMVLLRGMAPGRAIVLSARRMFAAPLPFIVLALVSIAILFVALASPWGALALLLQPWLMASMFAAWLDLSGAREPTSTPAKVLAAE